MTGMVVMLAFPDAEILDIAGPLDIICAAACSEDGTFDVSRHAKPLIVSEHGGPIETQPSSISIHTQPLKSLGSRKIDTLIVPGGIGTERALERPQLINWIRRTAKRARRVVSICTGAFLLAEAGLLQGRRATTHWRWVNEFAERYPDVTVESDSIFVADGNLYTSAGITAGMDLALHLVEQDWGADKALDIARMWLLYAKRPGGQSQFSALLPAKASEREAIADLQAWIINHVDADLSVPALAKRVAMSPRNFARVFQAETGVTPAKFVETVRIEAARRRLEVTAQSIGFIADACGMGDSERLRRSFIRRLGVNPSDYRRRFEQRANWAQLNSSRKTEREKEALLWRTK